VPQAYAPDRGKHIHSLCQRELAQGHASPECRFHFADKACQQRQASISTKRLVAKIGAAIPSRTLSPFLTVTSRTSRFPPSHPMSFAMRPGGAMYTTTTTNQIFSVGQFSPSLFYDGRSSSGVRSAKPFDPVSYRTDKAPLKRKSGTQFAPPRWLDDPAGNLSADSVTPSLFGSKPWRRLVESNGNIALDCHSCRGRRRHMASRALS